MCRYATQDTAECLSKVSKANCTRSTCHVDDSGSSERSVSGSFVVSASEMLSIFSSGIAEVGLPIGSSDDSVVADVSGGGVVDAGIAGETAVGEFRCCCSCSYSLIKRFFSGCALFDDTDVVGDAEEDTGEVAIGGVLLLGLVCIGLIGELRGFDDESTFMDNVVSYWGSAGDGSV